MPSRRAIWALVCPHWDAIDATQAEEIVMNGIQRVRRPAVALAGISGILER